MEYSSLSNTKIKSYLVLGLCTLANFNFFEFLSELDPLKPTSDTHINFFFVYMWDITEIEYRKFQFGARNFLYKTLIIIFL